jgi:hypothetical protein
MLRRALCHHVHGALKAIPRVCMQLRFFRWFRCHMSEPEDQLSVLANEHFRAFGCIIHLFARHEALMVAVMSVLLKTDSGELHMITSELPYRGKRDALLAMIKAKMVLPPEQVERITWFLGQLHKHNGLRNAIAHSTWKSSARPNAVKPLSLSVRGGAVTFKGIEDDEPDYTDEELVNIANELIRNYEQFRDYLLSVNLLPRPAAQN